MPRLWGRLAVTALIRPLAWEPTYATGVVLKIKIKKPSKFDYVLFVYLFIFVFSKAAPVAYVGSQARGLIGAVASSLRRSHSNSGSDPHV